MKKQSPLTILILGVALALSLLGCSSMGDRSDLKLEIAKAVKTPAHSNESDWQPPVDYPEEHHVGR